LNVILIHAALNQRAIEAANMVTRVAKMNHYNGFVMGKVVADNKHFGKLDVQRIYIVGLLVSLIEICDLVPYCYNDRLVIKHDRAGIMAGLNRRFCNHHIMAMPSMACSRIRTQKYVPMAGVLKNGFINWGCWGASIGFASHKTAASCGQPMN
jgi:hypothetical protein